MSWIQDTVADFGRQLGMPQLNLGDHGVMQLVFASGGLLAVEPVQRGGQDEVLVYLGRPVGHQAPALVRVALAKAHLAKGGPWPVQTALRGNGPDAMLMALVRLPQRAFTQQVLSQAVDYLTRWLDDVQAGQR